MHKVSKTGWAAFSVFHFFVSLLPLATAADQTSSLLSKLNFFFFLFFLHLNPWGDLGDSSAPFILFCLHSFRIWKVFLAGSFVLTAQSIQFSHSQVFYAARRDGICSRTESICRRVLILPRHYGLKLKGVLSSSLAQLCVHVSSTGHTSYSQLVKISFLILRRI